MLSIAKLPTKMRFEYWKSAGGFWTWELRTPVNDVLAYGCSYESREDCLAAMKLVQLATAAPVVDMSARRDDSARETLEFASVSTR